MYGNAVGLAVLKTTSMRCGRTIPATRRDRWWRIASKERHGGIERRPRDGPFGGPHRLRPDAARQLGGGLRQGRHDARPRRVQGGQALREHVPRPWPTGTTTANSALLPPEGERLSTLLDESGRWRQAGIHRLQRPADARSANRRHTTMAIQATRERGALHPLASATMSAVPWCSQTHMGLAQQVDLANKTRGG